MLILLRDSLGKKKRVFVSRLKKARFIIHVCVLNDHVNHSIINRQLKTALK